MFGSRYFGGRHFGRRYWGDGAPSVDLREALVAKLKGSAALAAILGTRVYPGRLPERATKPAATVSVISRVRGRNLAGSDGTAVARVQIDYWGDRLADCARAAAVVDLMLSGFSGPMHGVTVLWSWQVNEADRTESPGDSSDATVYRITHEFRVKFRMTIPTF